MLTVEQARAIFDAVVGMAGPTQALFEAQAAAAMNDLSDDDLVAVVEDYLDKKLKLENAITTRGVIA